MPLDLTAADPRLTTVAAVSALEGAVSAMPEGVVLRYGMLYGPDTWFQPGGPRADAAAEGRLAADRSVTSFLHVDDAAAAAVQALAWPPGIYNIVDDEPATGLQWVPDFCRCLGLPAPAPIPERARVGIRRHQSARPRVRLVADPSHLARQLGGRRLTRSPLEAIGGCSLRGQPGCASLGRLTEGVD